jgi:hypothetical protein
MPAAQVAAVELDHDRRVTVSMSGSTIRR